MAGGSEVYGFPPPGRLPQLDWLGPDYVSVLIRDLTRGLLRQDSGTQVMGVHCEADPITQAFVDPAGVIRIHEASFRLLVFVQDSVGRPWRLNGRWTYVGRELATAAPSVVHYWELYSADGV